MNRTLINTLILTALAAVFVITLLSLALVLDLTSTAEARQVLFKSLLIVSIVALASIVTVIISKFGSK